jgi:hypothetical protein
MQWHFRPLHFKTFPVVSWRLNLMFVCLFNQGFKQSRFSHECNSQNESAFKNRWTPSFALSPISKNVSHLNKFFWLDEPLHSTFSRKLDVKVMKQKITQPQPHHTKFTQMKNNIHNEHCWKIKTMHPIIFKKQNKNKQQLFTFPFPITINNWRLYHILLSIVNGNVTSSQRFILLIFITYYFFMKLTSNERCWSRCNKFLIFVGFQVCFYC